MRALPQIIGPTEQALTRLLLERGLAGTPIESNDEWVALNTLDRLGSSSRQRAIAALASTLTAPESRAAAALDALQRRGMIDQGDELSVSRAGSDALGIARQRVAAITEVLQEGFSAEDRAVAERILDAVRVRAQALLGVQG